MLRNLTHPTDLQRLSPVWLVKDKQNGRAELFVGRALVNTASLHSMKIRFGDKVLGSLGGKKKKKADFIKVDAFPETVESFC